MAHIPRIYIPGRIEPGALTLSGETARRLTGVMRLRPGEEFRVFSGDGHEWRATLRTTAKDRAQAEVGEVTRQEPLSERVLEMWVALVRPNRFDWAIEKCVEAGADIIRPLVSEFAARGEGASAQRQQRWERIVIEASEQSGRLHLVAVERPARFADLVSRGLGALVVADLSGQPPKAVLGLLPPRGRVAVAIGPEGGFSEAELATARLHGALLVSLGPHILRTETAAVIATAIFRAG